jgi:hypothetical protein
MRTVTVFLLLCTGILTKGFAYTERNLLQQTADAAKLKEVLIMNQQWVPYPVYTDRAGWDRFLGGDAKESFIKQGETQLDYEWKVVRATDYLEFERSGAIMQNPLISNTQAIADLLMAELAEGKGRFTDQLINGVFYFCEMTSWVSSAHLISAQRSKSSFPDYKDQVIDLLSADISSLLAWTYYFLHAEFDRENKVIAERLRHELQVRMLDPYMNGDRFWWMAVNYTPGMMVNNWNPWCNFNALQCFFLLENDRDRLAEAVYRTMVSVDKFINYTHSDGACEEGPSYWSHAAGKMYDYLQMLSDGTGGKISIFEQAIIRNMGEYIARSYVGNGWVVNFADASPRGGGDGQVIYRYGKAVNSEVMMSFAAYRNRLTQNKVYASGRDLFRTLQNVLYKDELSHATAGFKPPAYTWYPETEFCYMTGREGFFLAAKGGYNRESHNHNDIGTFSLYLNTVPVFIDTGAGTYTRQTFSSERYSIWTMQSNYHNVPMINGVPQAFGAEYKSRDINFNAGRMTLSMDIAASYPEEAQVKKWVRTYTLNKATVKITDSYVLNEAKAPNRVNFLTWGRVDISEPGIIKIAVDNEKIQLAYDKNLFHPSIETVKLDDANLSNVWGDEIYRISLNARKTALTGIYTYTITAQK